MQDIEMESENMGYRSDIVIVTKIENEELVKLLQEDEATANQYFFSMKDYNGKHMECFFTQYNYVKWYESYNEVKQIESAMHKIEDKDSFGFMRVGEDYDDVEVIGTPYDFNIQLSRNIDVDYENDYHIHNPKQTKLDV